MMGFVLYQGDTEVTLISGRTLSAAEVRERYPITTAGAVLLETTEAGWVGAIDGLDDVAARYGIDPGLEDEVKFERCVAEIVRRADPNYDEIEEILAAIEGSVG